MGTARPHGRTTGTCEINGYLISAADRAGIATVIFEAAAARGVNLSPAYGLADGVTGLILVGSDDEAGLQAALADAGVSGTPIEMVSPSSRTVPGPGRPSCAGSPTPGSACVSSSRSG